MIWRRPRTTYFSTGKNIIILGIIFVSTIPFIPITTTGNTDYVEPFYYHTNHPYVNNFLSLNVISRPNAISYKIYFSKIETEYNFDFVRLYDSTMTLRQSFTGNYPNGVTSDTITSSQITVKFTSDSSVTGWGYSIYKIEYTTSSTFESAHNYANNYDNSWIIQASQPSYATRIHIHFTKVELNTGDSIKIYNIQDTLVDTITDYHSSGTDSSILLGWKARIRLVTDGSGTAYGFKVGSITFSTSDEDQPCELSTLGVGNYESVQDLDNNDADIAREYFRSYGWITNRNTRDGNVLKSTFGDSDDSDLIYYTGHGQTGKCCLFRIKTLWETDNQKIEFTHSDANSMSIGSLDCEWMILAACDVLKDSTSNCKDFVKHGCHSVWGYRDLTYDGTDEKVICAFLNETLKKHQTIEYGWMVANSDLDINCHTSIYHSSCSCDHLWGHGMVFPDPVTNNDIYKAQYLRQP